MKSAWRALTPSSTSVVLTMSSTAPATAQASGLPPKVEPWVPGAMPDAALLFKQRLAELKDRHPDVIAEVRGEGLLIGLRAAVPAADLVEALRREKLITAAAGDNVVRLLPPLTISADEVEQGCAMVEAACREFAG